MRRPDQPEISTIFSCDVSSPVFCVTVDLCLLTSIHSVTSVFLVNCVENLNFVILCHPEIHTLSAMLEMSFLCIGQSNFSF